MFRRAYVSGTFDCLHRGHLALFAAVREVAVETVVSLNTDEFAARYKRTPLMPLAERMAVLEQCRLVDQVVVNVGDEDSKIAIVAANVDCIVHGDDWQGESLMKQMGLDPIWLEVNGITMVVLPYTKAVDTTGLIAAHNARIIAAEAPVPGWPPEAAVPCNACGRIVLAHHVNVDGNCGCVVEIGHELDNA